MDVEKILYATNVEKSQFEGLEPVTSFRGIGLKEVVLLHEGKMDGWEENLAEWGISTKAYPTTGSMAKSILDAANREAVSLIAVNVNKKGVGKSHGSLTKILLRHSPVPVNILMGDRQYSETEKGGLFERIVFATDWSAGSEKALSFIIDLKNVIHSLEIVHVIEKRLSIKDMRDIKDQLAETRKIFLDEGVDAEPHIYAGRPSDEILLAAKEYHATCIVMGIHRRSRIKELVNKSDAYRVADATVVPILVIP